MDMRRTPGEAPAALSCEEENMTRNVGGLDRILRIVVGLALLSLVVLLEGGARWFGLIGLVPLLTGLFSFCPLYGPLGFNTCPLKDRADKAS